MMMLSSRSLCCVCRVVWVPGGLFIDEEGQVVVWAGKPAMAVFVVMLVFGMVLVSMAKSYVDADVKAQVFARVRLDSGRHGQSLRRRRCEGNGLRSCTACFCWLSSFSL